VQLVHQADEETVPRRPDRGSGRRRVDLRRREAGARTEGDDVDAPFVLRDAGIAELDPDGGYRLTADGRTLLAALAPLDDWAARWARRR